MLGTHQVFRTDSPGLGPAVLSLTYEPARRLRWWQRIWQTLRSWWAARPWS